MAVDVREKLVELIEKASYECDEGTRDLWDMREVANGIADFLIANGVTVQEWISVKDRLPEKEGDYLIYATAPFNGRKFMTVMHYEKGAYLPIWSDTTHWMPLPKPPKGE